ncbi:MAG: hypothetical protein AAB975_03220, partial [Patescibacteria group bacterium]
LRLAVSVWGLICRFKTEANFARLCSYRILSSPKLESGYARRGILTNQLLELRNVLCLPRLAGITSVIRHVVKML